MTRHGDEREWRPWMGAKVGTSWESLWVASFILLLKSQFLSIGTIAILSWIIFCRMFSSISGFYLPMLVPPSPTVMATKNISRYCQMSPKGKSAPDDNLWRRPYVESTQSYSMSSTPLSKISEVPVVNYSLYRAPPSNTVACNYLNLN